MSRRWKVGIVLGVLGIAAFLVWAFRSNPVRGVQIQFLGYQNNGMMDHIFPPDLISGQVTAQLCLTNGSRRAIACFARGTSQQGQRAPDFTTETMFAGHWRHASGFYWGPPPGSWGNIVLKPGESIRFSAENYQPNDPTRVTIQYSSDPNFIQRLLTQSLTPATTNKIVVTAGPGSKAVANSTLTRLQERALGWFRRKQINLSVSIII